MADIGKSGDGIEALSDLLLGQAHHRRVEHDIFAAGEFAVEARAQFQHRRQPAMHLELPSLGCRVPQINCSRVDLPAPFSPITPSISPRTSSDRHASAPRIPHNSAFLGRPEAVSAGRRAGKELVNFAQAFLNFDQGSRSWPAELMPAPGSAVTPRIARLARPVEIWRDWICRNRASWRMRQKVRAIEQEISTA